MDINETLDERQQRYGSFDRFSAISQELKYTIARNISDCKPYQVEALEMIAHKMARILNGDPDYIDNWHDIAGYATLVERELLTEQVL